MKCAGLLNSDIYNMSDNSTTAAAAAAAGDDNGATDAPWLRRMRELQGAVILASLGEVVLGVTGLIGLLVRYIGPLTIAPVITMIALPMVQVAANYAQRNWWIALLYAQLPSSRMGVNLDKKWRGPDHGERGA